MDIAAFLVGKEIHVLKFPHIIHGKNSVLNAGRITVHAALVVSPQEPVYIKADEVAFLFLRRKERALHGLFPAYEPRLQRISDKFQALLLNVREGCMFQIADHVRRDAENPRNFV